MKKKCFIIDDEPGSYYIENIDELLSSSDAFEVQTIGNVSEARERVAELVSSDLVIIDLMLPETNPANAFPQDDCQIGMEFCERLIGNQSFGGFVACITNAKKERHFQQLDKMEHLANNSKRISLSFKYKIKSIALADKLLSEVGRQRC